MSMTPFVTKDGDSARFERAKLDRAWQYARPYRREIVILLAIILSTTFLGLLQPLIFRDLIDVTLPQQNRERLNAMALGLLFIPLAGGWLSVYRRRLSARIAEGVTFDLRRDLYTHLQGMSLRFYTATRTGELMSRINNDVRDAQRAISDTIIKAINEAVNLVMLLGVMLLLEWRLLLMGLLLLPVFIPLSKRASDAMHSLARQQANDNASMNAHLHETLNIGGAVLAKLFGQRQAEIGRFTGRAAQVRDVGVQRAVIAERFSVIASLLGAVGVAGVYWVGGLLVLEGVFTIGTIVAFAAYLTRFYSTLQRISGLPPSLATSLVSFERVFEVLDVPQDIQEATEAITLEHIRGDIRFENVTFRYADQNEVLQTVQRRGHVEHALGDVAAANEDMAAPAVAELPTSDPTPPTSQARDVALQAITFTVQPGQLVALVGPSGAGKTTLTYLIPRLYDPSSGSVLLDGHDLRTLTLDTLSRHIAMVTQETTLFHDTLLTNLQYANPAVTPSDIEAACRAANIHDYIAGLPQGYQTVVGERGYRLSGGEKQRIAIARVILKNPRILVLDEATSHLDSHSEKLIQQALQSIIRGRTALVIAHRLSTIVDADLILVLNRGQIVERGRHDDLLTQDGLYAQLYRTQFLPTTTD